jgi:hypothetical protein
MPVDAARRILGDQAVIGFSTHNLEQIREACGFQLTILPSDQSSRPPASAIRIPVAGLDQLKRAL